MTNNKLQTNNKTQILNSKLFLCLFVFFFVSFSVANAATLYFSPSSGSYRVGQGFSVKVLVSSTDRKMNAAGADISFSPEDLELVSISESNSLIDVWGEKPEFSNSNGRASFEGLILDGYQGPSGEIATLIFRAKSPGETAVRFSTGSVLAYNGLGTSILEGLEQAVFTIIPTVGPVFEIPEKIPEGFEFTKDLSLNDEELEVAYLQLCFREEGVYSEDITGYFGSKTRSAVNRFQEKYFDDILAPDGFSGGTSLVRERTRKKLNEVCISLLPEQLFDITVRLEDTTIVKANNLEAVITFESFGRVPTPVDISYTIVNNQGQNVFKDTEIIVVETEEVMRKRFYSVNLLPGRYTLMVKTQYNIDVIDEFRNDFVIEEVIEKGIFIDLSLLVWLLILCAIIIILLSISNILCYLQYRALKRKKSKILDRRTIEKHLLQDKKLRKELEKGEALVKNLKKQLNDAEGQIRQVGKKIKDRAKNK